MTQYIYGLTDEHGIVRYIGCTKHNMKSRLEAHWSQRNNKDTPLCKWLRTLPDKPELVLLDIVSPVEDKDAIERFHILAHNKAGFNLLNVMHTRGWRYGRLVRAHPAP